MRSRVQRDVKTPWFVIGLIGLLLALVALAVACSSGSSAGNGGGNGGQDVHAPPLPDSGPIGRDNLGGDNGGGIPPQGECAVDTHCPDEHYCDCRYKCQPAFDGMCENDMNCGSDAYCDPCERVCQPRLTLCQPCVTENRCDPRTGICERVGVQCESPNINAPSHCLDFADGNSYCGLYCLSNHGCPFGYECMEIRGFPSKQCVPLVRSCGSAESCDDDGDCPYGEVCKEYGLCAPGCSDDQECPVVAGRQQVCSAFRCQDACHDVENPCEEGLECINGRCRIPGSCRDKYECLEPETFCNPETNMCEDGCLEDFDCKQSAMICVDGACERRPCERNWYCAFEQVCNYDTGECEQAEGPYCDECDPNQEGACGENNECIGLQDEDGNPLGDYCFVQCLPTEYDRCPQGYECVPLQDQSGATQNELCFRDCSRPPVVREY